MIVQVLRWIVHWLGQGLKLWFFAALASVCLFPLGVPLGLLEDGAFHFEKLSILGKAGIVVGYVVCFAIGTAVFTALLASFLKDDPLRPFGQKDERKDGESSDTEETEQAGLGNSGDG